MNVGNTPLIKLSDKLYGKVESVNPGCSIKDRPVKYILDRMNPQPGETIVEATSGKKLKWPIIIRLDGTNSKEGLEILKNNPNDNIFISENMDEAAKLAVESGV